jgi:HTH-type transcriptional regulator/antitoxin HipB
MDYTIHLPAQLREHLRALRKERGLTQAALGHLLGVGQARVAEIENNPGVVSVEQLMRVLSVLQTSLVLRDEADEAERRLLDGVNLGQVVPSETTPQPVKLPAVKEPPTSRRNFIIRPRKGSW